MLSAKESKGNPNRQTLEEIVSGKKEEPSAEDDDPDPAEWVKTSYTYDITAPYYEVLTETINKATTAYDYGVERLSSYSSSSAWDKIKTQYVYGGRGSVAQELSNNNSWYTFGGALAKTTKTSYMYTPFGEMLENESSGFRFNHEYYDAATGMLNLRARQYEPAIVRFSQRDIWRGKVETPTTQNRYLYCVNDPIGYYDRSGNRVDEDAGKPKKVTPSTNTKKIIPFSNDTAQSQRQEQFAIQKINSANRKLDTILKNAGVDTNNLSDAEKEIVRKARKEFAQKAANGTLTASETNKAIVGACTSIREETTNSFIANALDFFIEYSSAAAGFSDGLLGTDGVLHGKEEAYYKGKMVGDIVRLLGVTYAGAVAITEMILGGAATIGGGGLCLTGAGTIAGVPAIAGGVALVAAGVVTVGSTLAIGADALADFQKDWDAYQDSTGNKSANTPNPNGKNGGPLHQAKIQETAEKLRNEGYDVSFEKYVKTPDGFKGSRYGDILATNSETGEQYIIQVGKQTKAGNPISRETKAISDLINAGWNVEFVPYN